MLNDLILIISPENIQKIFFLAKVTVWYLPLEHKLLSMTITPFFIFAIVKTIGKWGATLESVNVRFQNLKVKALPFSLAFHDEKVSESQLLLDFSFMVFLYSYFAHKCAVCCVNVNQLINVK